MKKNIILTLVIVVALIAINMFFSFGHYAITQNYTQVAADQVNDDSAYYALKTKPFILQYLWLIKTGIGILGLYFIYLVWKPKKVSE
jgi:hypothetical protein